MARGRRNPGYPPLDEGAIAPTAGTIERAPAAGKTARRNDLALALVEDWWNVH